MTNPALPIDKDTAEEGFSAFRLLQTIAFIAFGATSIVLTIEIVEGAQTFGRLWLILIVVLYLISSIKILAEYERGVIFRLGKLLPHSKGPGLIFVFTPIDRMVRVGLRIVVLDVPPQDVITRDNVSV